MLKMKKKNLFFGQKLNIFIPRPSWRSYKLQEKPTVVKREHHHFKTTYGISSLFSFFEGHFCQPGSGSSRRKSIMDPDPQLWYRVPINGETWPRSSPSSIRALEKDMSRLLTGNRTRASAVGREHSNLANSYSNSLFTAFRNIYMSSRQFYCFLREEKPS